MVAKHYDVLIVGGSIAALRAAETVIQRAPHLRLGIVSDEEHPPYERPPLSKVGLDESFEIGALVYPGVAKLQTHGVDFLLSTRATALDTEARMVRTSNGDVSYGAVIITTGCEPFIPPVFRDQDNTYVLRRFEDAIALRAAVSDPSLRVAVVGAGFIGGEFASTLGKAGRRVSLIDLAPHPLGRFGDEPSTIYENLHRDADVDLFLGAGVESVLAQEGRRYLALTNGALVPADVVVLGVGVRPSTSWLEQSSVTVGNGIVCDANLRAADHVYAAGDAVLWPNPRWGAVMRIEHWTNAAEQGRVAALNAISTLTGEEPVECSTVPYFWSDQQGQRIQFAGYRTGDEEMIVDAVAGGTIFYYVRGDEVVGVLAFERRAEFTKLRAQLRKGLSRADLPGVILHA